MMFKQNKLTVLVALVTLGFAIPSLGYSQSKEVEEAKQNKTKQFIEAQKKSAVPKARKDAHATYRSAVILLQEGWEDGNVDYVEVEKRLRDSISTDPTYSRPYLFLGKVFEDQWKFSDAIDAYRDATRKTVDKEDGFVSLARVYARTDRASDANKVLGSVLKLNPKNAAAKTVMASIMRKQGDLAGAKKLLREALGHSPDSVETYKELALVYYQSKNYKYARLSLLKAIKLKENDPSIYNSMGLISLKEGDQDKAIGAFRKAIEVDEQFFPPHMNLSAIYLERGYFARALESLDTAKRLQPGNPAVSTSLGVAYRGLNDFKKAEENFKNALNLDSGYAPALYNLGVLNFRHLNNPEEAKKYFADYRARGGKNTMSQDVPDTTEMVDLIQRSSAKQAEIDSLADRQLSAAARLKKASALRADATEQYRQAEIAETKLFAPRIGAEKEIGAIDEQLAKTRSARFETEKKLISVVGDVRKQRASAAEKDKAILAEESKIAALMGERAQIEQQIEDYYTNRKLTDKNVEKINSSIEKMEKTAGISHASVKDSIDAIEKSESKLRSSFSKASRKLNRTKSDLQKQGERFGNLVAEHQSASQRRSEIAGEFEVAAKQLMTVEKKIADFNAEVRAIESNRVKAEQDIDKLIAELEQLQKRRAEEQSAYWKLSEDRQLEEKLVALDQRRQTAGGRLQTLEKQRKKLLEELKNRTIELNDSWEDLQYVSGEWEKQVGKLDKKRIKINALESERGQVLVKIKKLVEEREQTRTKIASILKERSKLNSISSKAEKRVSEVAADLSAIAPQWKELSQQRDSTIVSIRKNNGVWSDKVDQLKTARIGSAAKLQGDQLASYKSLRDDYDSATKQRISLDQQAFDLFEKLIVTDKDLLGRVQAIAKIQDERVKLAQKSEASEAKYETLQNVWTEADRDSGQLIDKREKLEKTRDKLDEQQLKIAKERGQLLAQRAELVQKENEIRSEVAQRDKERRESLTRDLLNSKQTAAPTSEKTTRKSK